MRLLRSQIRKCWLWLVLGAGVGGGCAFLGWQHYYPVQVSGGWSFGVYLDDITYVSALVVDRQGTLYVSQEFKNEDGAISRRKPDGSWEKVISELSKPDGLTLFRDGIVVSQEGVRHPVLLWHEGKTEILFEGNNVEGMASDGRNLFAVEDSKQGGRLLKYDPETKEIQILRDDLEESEGVTVCPDGSVLFTEKKRGWIKRFQAKGKDEIVASGLHSPSFITCDSDGLWITEDLTHRARLLLLDGLGTMHTILSHLRSPQAIIAISPTRFLVAEQGRGRILELNRLPNAKQ